MVPDSQHDSLAPTVEAADSVLPGFREAVDPMEPVEAGSPPIEGADTATPPGPSAQERSSTYPNFGDFTASRIDRLLKEFGDMNYEGPEGYGVTFREAIENMHRELGETENLGKAHEVAAACFLYTDTAG